ncbi:methyltransferase domain-containing protein [Acidianus sp. HS-5]|uniref:methyltransferase domain-containing protein n=1 Tax=Acidianus sp. HS-5 TaxID=2886040 RepID=UPI001F401191|nr:methyltransferase domain-containing protein [Acidianus sp. HS-5]
MSSIFDSINSWNYKPFRRMGITICEEVRIGKLVSSFIKRLNPRRVLEIGCGNCLVTLSVEKEVKPPSLVSIEVWNNEITDKEVKNYLRGEDSNLVENLFPLPFKDKTFDLAYSALYFYNTVRKERSTLAGEVSKVIKDKGYFILIEPEIVRNIRKDFFNAGFSEVEYHVDQGIFFSLMVKDQKQ